MDSNPIRARSGALVIDKPEGLSSSQAVTKLKWALVNAGLAEKGFKIGHGGTLDPFATGVLVVLIGEATKLADCYLHSKKSYSGIIQLGLKMDSGDPTGTPVRRDPVPALTLRDWQESADRFVKGPYLQTPPMHSAKKKDGRALYDLAREGIEIEREAILKTIHSFRIGPGRTSDQLTFEVACESGTYVRVLAEDLAALRTTSAHLLSLRRTSSSDRALLEAVELVDTLRKIETGSRNSLRDLPGFVDLPDLATHLPSLSVPEGGAGPLRQGISKAIEALGRQADTLETASRYVLARTPDRFPVALLERPIPATPFRLQRIFNF